MSGTSDAFSSDLDYLWRAVGDAQDASARSEKERTSARKSLEEAASRAASLERRLEESLSRERRLKAEAEKLKEAAGMNSETLAKAREASELQSRLLKKESERAMLDAELEDMRARTGGLTEALAARDAAIESFKEKIAGIMALPEVARAVKEDSAVSGKPVSAYEELLEKAEKSRRAAENAAKKLAEAAAGESSVREALTASERELSGMRAAMTGKARELEALEKALADAEETHKISAGEKASLEGRALALKSALAEKEIALAAAISDSAALRARLDDASLEAGRLRQAAAESSQRTEEQRANFAAAVTQVFELQKRAAALKSALAAAQEQNDSASAALKVREADLEKINGLLRDAKGALSQEKEISKRAAIKIKSLEAEIEGLKAKMAAAADYSARLLKSVEERELHLGAQKAASAADQKKISALEIENEDLHRRNIKFSGMLKREQTDFTTRMLTGLERSAKDLKSFNLRIPAVERKALEPALKNLLASVNLLKGWQEYLDPETPDMEDTELAPFVSGESSKWERAFKVRKISISVAVLNPRLRARLSPERMKMLFYNLIKNAYERLQQGGSLRVTLKATEDGREAILTFDDTGPGFAMEALDKLYAPFNTTDKGKAGIGLAVSARIAEKHGGTLKVSNKKERGAIVEVRLPLGS